MKRLNLSGLINVLDVIPLISGFTFGLAASRVVYEAIFPELLWLGRRGPSLALALLVSLLSWQAWRIIGRSLGRRDGNAQTKADQHNWATVTPFVPLLLNAISLVSNVVDADSSRHLLLSSLWMGALAATCTVVPRRWRGWISALLVTVFLAPIYFSTLGRTVGTADTFEFQVVVPRLGIVHPTGYPLYLLLTRIATFLPLNSVAWRINMATALYGLIATAILFGLLWRMSGRAMPSALAAALFGLSPTFWSQAVEAEVYTLHTVLVGAALLLIFEMVQPITTYAHRPRAAHAKLLPILLAFVVGLGLTNHLTTIILLPAALLTLGMHFWPRPARQESRYLEASGRLAAITRILPGTALGSLLLTAMAFLAPLLLYLYLPLRWAAVNGEPMGLGRFVDWVIGGRFQGALQLSAWLQDPDRFAIVGRLLQAEWPSFWLWIPIIIALGWSLLRWRRFAAILIWTWLGYVFYGLNYHVPDLSVFLIPAFLVMATFWGLGLVVVIQGVASLASQNRGLANWIPVVTVALTTLAFFPGLLNATNSTWGLVDRSVDEGRTAWGRAVLGLDLDKRAAILADSDKFPPLYYLQQAEGLREDLDIVLLPDEAAYRASLENRIAQGQTVYLARYLPNLEGIFHLRSIGPLIHVDQSARYEPPEKASPADVSIGPFVLEAYEVSQSSPLAFGATAFTFYWRTQEPIDRAYYVYTRWSGELTEAAEMGQHPANNTYPTIAWRQGELVADFHTLPRPIAAEGDAIILQVAMAPPFTPAGELEWHNVTTMSFDAGKAIFQGSAVRANLGDSVLDKMHAPGQARPGSPILLLFSGRGRGFDKLTVTLRAPGLEASINGSTRLIRRGDGGDSDDLVAARLDLANDVPDGRYMVWVSDGDADNICGWFARPAVGCSLGEIEIGGVPLPPGATNFDDQIAMLSFDLSTTRLESGGQLEVRLTWQASASLNENYTIFLQVLDNQDRIVGQVDSWPLQGTYPTSEWRRGEVVRDAFTITLDDELPSGPYKLYVGWYLLETLRRLPVLDESGMPIDDKFVVGGLIVPDSLPAQE